MKEQKKLTLGMIIFVFVIFVSFGIIILNEKSAPYFIPKIEKKLTKYLKTNHKDELKDLEMGKTKYLKTKYEVKITSKINKDLYFKIYYYNKKFLDTYETDYKEGKTLINTLTKNLEKELKSKYNETCNIIFINTLDSYSEEIKNYIIEKNKIKDLEVYTLENTITVDWNTNSIGKKIIALNTKFKSAGITPKNYNITVINSKDTKKRVKINNLTTEIIENTDTLTNVISAIIKDEESDILTSNNITYKYLN